MRVLAAATLMLMWTAAPAWAEGPVSTAASIDAPQPTAGAPALPEAADSLGDNGQPVRMGPCGPAAVDANGKTDQSAHGQVDVGVGTSGYRHIGGRVCKPLGDNAAVAVSVSETQGTVRYGR